MNTAGSRCGRWSRRPTVCLSRRPTRTSGETSRPCSGSRPGTAWSSSTSTPNRSTSRHAGLPVSVRSGDGTVLGALTRPRLESLVAGLSGDDPWLVLEKAPEVYAQTLREGDGSFVLEHRVGGPDRHWSCEVSSADATVTRLWRWVDADDDWDEGLDWQPVTW